MDTPPFAAKSILDSLNEGVFTVDRDWRITAFNAAAEQITGVPADEALGSPCCEVFRADVCETDCVMRRTMRSGEPVVNARVAITDHDGQRIPIRVSTALLRDDAGAVIGGVESFQDCSQLVALQKQLAASYTFEDIVGHSHPMRELFAILPPVAASGSTVLIEGESGTGKELVARAIHNLSSRRAGPFVAVNCAALPDNLLESELFGHKRGAFTGATSDRPGFFATANGGTLFLDEIGDISPAMQVRLLRVLQEQEIQPVGGSGQEAIDVRVVTATNRDLAAEIAAGRFRSDLYYRVHVVPVHLPALRDRREDIPVLIDHFIARCSHLQDRLIRGATDAFVARLVEYDFPGNVRELENIIERACVLCDGEQLATRQLPPELRGDEQPASMSVPTTDLKTLTTYAIRQALSQHHGNRQLAARDLGIDVNTLYRKLRQGDIETPDRDGRGRRRKSDVTLARR